MPRYTDGPVLGEKFRGSSFYVEGRKTKISSVPPPYTRAVVTVIFKVGKGRD